jgi:hypothetical protein
LTFRVLEVALARVGIGDAVSFGVDNGVSELGLLTRLLGAAQGSQHSGVGVMDLLAADPGFVRAREPLDGPGRVLQGLLRLALNQERKAGLELRPGMTGAEAAADARGFQSATERSGEIAPNPLRPSQRVRELDA